MKSRLNLVAVGAFAIALIALLIFAARQDNVRRLQAGFLGLITPFLRSGSDVDRKVTAFREGMKTVSQLDSEVKGLRTSNAQLSAENQTLRGLEAENNQLRNALRYRERAVFQLMPARIIARDASTWYHTVTIDRGSAELIAPDMPVLTEEGLVGKTTIVSEHSSVVVLLSDENCKVSVNVENTREQGIARGERNSSNTIPVVSLYFLSKDAKLQPGTKVLTSGVGGVFPPGITVGTVKEFRVNPGALDGSATIVPAVDLTTLQDVFVVVSETK
jgi:rod shape-determining protein MreC